MAFDWQKDLVTPMCSQEHGGDFPKSSAYRDDVDMWQQMLEAKEEEEERALEAERVRNEHLSIALAALDEMNLRFISVTVLEVMQATTTNAWKDAIVTGVSILFAILGATAAVAAIHAAFGGQ